MSVLPIEYRFGSRSTATEVLADVDLTGHLAVITGATSGIGVATAEALAAAGADLVIGARNSSKLDELLMRLQHRKKGTASGFALDLMSVDSVDKFADCVLHLERPVNFLINNAGRISGHLSRNPDGIESQLMTNYIGHAILTSRLSRALQQVRGARVVQLSSVGHHHSPCILDDLNFENRPYTTWGAYGHSKTACILLTVQISAAMKGKGVDAFAVHPGGIKTEMANDLSLEDLDLAQKLGSIPKPEDFKSPEQGAATTVWAATEPQLHARGPIYLEDCRIATILEQPSHTSGVMPYALNPAIAAKLWSKTEKLIGRTLPLN